MKNRANTDIAYSYIRNKIISKALYPGCRIVEEDIVNETGVSRTPVRSALMRLAYEGMIVLYPNRGAEVAKPTKKDLLQVYEARRILELDAFRLAVERRSDESVAQLRENLNKQKSMKDISNMVEYVELNREFHWIIAMQAQNAYVEKYVNELQNKVSTYLLFWDSPEGNDVSIEIHNRIYEAFRDRDVEKGLKAINEDIALGIDSVDETNT